MKKKSYSVVFNEKFGGKWKYIPFKKTWECNDGIREIRSVLTGMDYNGEYTGETSLCMYFNDNSTSPEWVYVTCQDQ